MALRIEFPAGVLKEKAIERLIVLAETRRGPVVANINDIDITAYPDSSAGDLMRYHRKMTEILHYMEDNKLDTSILLTSEPFK